mmetsp:Transcript_37995/g.74683  ORF Transcript_37995/g.74683 Transcript_37995/m.74683 type:complete len:95 (+) Transcript_37995:140-424(+)
MRGDREELDLQPLPEETDGDGKKTSRAARADGGITQFGGCLLLGALGKSVDAQGWGCIPLRSEVNVGVKERVSVCGHSERKTCQACSVCPRTNE